MLTTRSHRSVDAVPCVEEEHVGNVSLQELMQCSEVRNLELIGGGSGALGAALSAQSQCHFTCGMRARYLSYELGMMISIWPELERMMAASRSSFMV